MELEKIKTMEKKQYYNQKDLPYSSVGLILNPNRCMHIFKVMPDAPDGRWLSDWECDQEHIKEEVWKRNNTIKKRE